MFDYRNLSRFLITSNSTPSLFGTSCLFGRVIRGLAVIRTAMNLAVDKEGTTREPVILANTTVIEDGPIPENFAFPEKPSLRPNPMVPPACSSLMSSKTVAGLAHSYTKQAGKAHDLVDNQPAPQPEVMSMDQEEPEVAPGEDPAQLDEAAAAAAAEYNQSYYTATPEVMYGTNLYEGNDEANAEELKRHYRVQERNAKEAKAQEEAYSSIISSGISE